MTGRRRRVLRGASVGLTAVVAVGALVVMRTSLNDAGGAQSAGPVPSLPSGAPAITSGATPASAKTSRNPTSKAGLGVFEPVRGWIVYPIGNRLEAVNPADPAERHTLKLPAGLDVLLGGGTDLAKRAGTNRPVPAGWSADGTELALTSEHFGDAFVMHADGSIARVDFGPQGCCIFVTLPWLSPDGTTELLGVSRDGILYHELASGHSDTRELDPPLPANRDGWVSAWSADGSQIAFVTAADETGAEPTVHVADFTTGANRVVAELDSGHVRHIVWSPDDTQVLVVAGGPLPRNVSLNPLVSPRPTKLFLVDTDGSGVREIASGYYVATAWSPDGTQIAAIEYTGFRNLVVMDADGTRQRTLVELPGNELFTGLAWHPLVARD